MISALSFATFAVSPDKAELRLRLSFTLILTSVTFKYVITQSLPRISYLTYMDKYVLMSLAILCIISIWHAVITIIPISTIQNASDNSTLMELQKFSNASPASAFRVTSGNPDLLRQSLNRASTSTSTPQMRDRSKNRRRRTWPSSGYHGNSGPDPSLSNDIFFDPSTSTYTPSSAFRSNGASVGDFTLTNETVSLYFLALLRAYMDIQDQIEANRLPKAQKTDEQQRLEVMKRLERNVFISFAVLYVIVHCIFVFILYFDVSGWAESVELCFLQKYLLV
ncbi:unnamed protein product [Mesocestoides corti]|uniref:Neurotransmitter-gated ion-channel transmembrane domain-containing protein n=1 Tax=Mesocestoides corti TaxID=53468 RepID=A0A0R3U7L9_MESCO|nr:unnamed protein product [Mesocestoides corti]